MPPNRKAKKKSGAKSDEDPSTAKQPLLLSINGFREDVSVLLSDYLRKQSFRLEDFVTVWEDLKFGYVFGGTQTTRGETAEINEFAEKCFREAVMLCIPPYEPVHRVAGLYLLYSLYISRPLHCHVRIRIQPSTEFLPLVQFMDVLLENKHYDTVFVFLELFEQQAFRFTATPLEMGWHTQRSRQWRDDAANVHIYLPDVPELLTNPVFTNVLAQDESYSAAKSRLIETASNDCAVDAAQLSYTSDDFRAQVERISLDYEKQMQDLNRGVLLGEANDEEEKDDEEEASDETVERRRKLREKVAKRTVELWRS